MNTLALILLLAVPGVDYVDDAGRARSTETWTAAPTLLVPFYARCPDTCALIAAGVKRGVQSANADPATYRVVLFSFDDRDRPADLRAFRDRHKLPLSWTLASAGSPQVRSLMDSVGFQYTTVGGQFAHPNQVIVLSGKGEVATRLTGISFTGEQIDGALKIARGRTDWVAEFGPWMLAVLLFVCTLSVVYLGALLMPFAKGTR